VRNEPHQNGVAERANRTIGEGVTALLKESRLPPSFWGYALNAFVYAHMRSPTAAISTKKTPYELWHGEKPDVSNLRIFGSAAYVHIQKDLGKRAMALPGSSRIPNFALFLCVSTILYI